MPPAAHPWWHVAVPLSGDKLSLDCPHRHALQRKNASHGCLENSPDLSVSYR